MADEARESVQGSHRTGSAVPVPLPRGLRLPRSAASWRREVVQGDGRRWRTPGVLLPWALGLATALFVVATVVRQLAGVPAPMDVGAGRVLIGLAVVVLALRPVLRRGQRLAWALLAAGVLAWLAGDLAWEIEGDAAGLRLQDIGYLTFYPCAAATLLLLTARQTRGAPWGPLLDGLVAALGTAAVGALFLPRLTGPAGDPAVLLDLAYPFADLVLLATALGVLAAQAWRLTRVWALLCSATLLLVTSDLHYMVGEATGDYVPGTPWDLGWAVGFALLGLAAWQPSVPGRSGTAPPALVVPTLVTAVSVGILVAAADRPVPGVAVAFAAAALAGAVVRTALAVGEMRALVESRRLALTDELTGLGNRRLLADRLAGQLARRRPDQSLAVLLLDLDRFKEVNDALGHQVGDELLRGVGPRLEAVLREGDTLARLGGDEFALLLGAGADATHAQLVAARVRDALREPFLHEGVQLHLDVSVGIAVCPDHAVTAEGLLRCADVAMYVAKQSRTGYAIYSQERDLHDRSRLQTIAQLHTALATDQVTCHYQPQCDLASGEVVGAEALVRWQHPQHGLLSPDAFLGLAAQVGLMPRLTRRVLATALQDCAAWRRAGADLCVSVNLSALSLDDQSLPGDVARLLRTHGLPPEALVLEVTEDVMLVHAQRAHDVVARLRALGVRLSIDDYGTGHSSLARLRILPVHELKLDRSYIAGLGSDERDAAIVRSTVDLAHALGLAVVAEGVETADDWWTLRALHCDRAQGYLLSRPLPQECLLRWLGERRGALPGAR